MFKSEKERPKNRKSLITMKFVLKQNWGKRKFCHIYLILIPKVLIIKPYACMLLFAVEC